MKTIVLVAVLVTGCGGAPFEVKATCHAAGLTTFLENDRGCAYYEELAISAESLLVSNGFVSQADYDTRFTGLQVWVHDESRTILCQNGGSAGGCYHPGQRYIELARTGGGLAHELLHHADTLAGRERDDHSGWGSEGHPDRSSTPYTIAGEPDGIYVGSWRDVSQRWYYAADARFETVFGR